ncbi:ABC transporter ATP-binding protein [Eubacteriaceae bacterium ES3]|nr:ABC transporter ATP-binding protein [Eubacteriaceae bacterium ES3]
MAMDALLELKKITKSFNDLKANDEISFSLEKGQIHALLGENGAGKSTLMNIIFGIIKQDSGAIIINGREVEINSPKDAIKNGIGMVHQHFMLISTLTVAENIILSMVDQKGLLLDKANVIKRIKEISEKYQLEIDPNMLVADLTVGQQQRVEIIKAVYTDCNLLILDEPTAVLTPRETEQLFEIIHQLKSEDKSVIFISHKLNEVMKISEKISVLRNGRLVAERDKEATSQKELAALMVGKEVAFVVNEHDREPGEDRLVVNDLTVKGKRHNLVVKNLNLKVRAGEIYGIAGVDGNGQTELIKAISALDKAASGSVKINGRDMTNKKPNDILECGVSHIPEDRQADGVLMSKSILENMILHDIGKKEYKKGPFINWPLHQQRTEERIAKYNVKTPDIWAPMESLSGGNQQKVVIARELEKNPDLLLAVHPTRGVDIGAIEFIHKEIIEAKNRGCAVLLVSTELDEIMALSDRIGVMYDGQILGEMDRKSATIERIGCLMAGLCESEEMEA